MIKSKAYTPFTSKEIKPSGWLRKQLRIQADGLSGNLDKIWPDIRDSRWIGGGADGWERVPYWLDGFVPLAYLLEDEDLIKRAQRYIDGIISNQKNDGWICPCEDSERGRYDMWAYFLICKVLALYADCSGQEERIEKVLTKALKRLMFHIRGNTLFNWGSARWFECLIPIFWLYERTKEDWLIYLAQMLKVQGTNYRALFEEWQDQKPHNDWNYQTHVVNLAMAIKAEVFFSLISSKEDSINEGEKFAEFMLGELFKYHGTVYGHFTGDENLSGDSPIQGSELCGVVEAMYSYEQIFAITGSTRWLDRAEMLAYNALPAATSPDMWTHQYDQMTNQMACVRFMGRPIFGTNGPEAHLFGLEPNFGCCTANFNQGWPKFALSTFMKTKDGVLSAVIAPAVLNTQIDGKKVTVELDTEYPFKSSAKYTVRCAEQTDFELAFRIPGFVKNARVGDKTFLPGEVCRIKKLWHGEESIDVTYVFETELVKRPRDMAAIKRGALVYSLSIEEEWKKHEYIRGGVERKYPYCDYEIYPRSKWNYAFASREFEVTEGEIGDYPFSSTQPPITIRTRALEIDWGMEEGYNDLAAKVPHSREGIGDPEWVTFKPYGCTNLRMTELPVLCCDQKK